MVVNYTAKGDSFVAEKPRVWSEKRIANVGQFINYDPAPDGKTYWQSCWRKHRKPNLGRATRFSC
jgi:hypothetical protein